MKMTKGKIAAAAAVAATLGYGACTTYVAPNEWGVRQTINSPFGLLGKTGYQNERLEGGRLYFTVPFFSVVRTLPRELQAVTFNRFVEGQQRREFDVQLPALRVATADTYTVTVDATLHYQITDPYKVLTTLGRGNMYETSGVLQRAPKNITNSFGAMQPEDFFQVHEDGTAKGVPKRVVRQEVAKKELNNLLGQFGITAKGVFIRYPEYDPKVQETFENNAEKGQLKFTERAESLLAAQQALLDKLVTQGEQAANVRRAEGDGYYSSVKGQSDAYRKDKQSHGDRLEREANAEALRLRNESLEGAGSEYLVAMEAAAGINPNTVKQILLPVCGDKGFNPTNMDQTVRQLTGRNK